MFRPLDGRLRDPCRASVSGLDITVRERVRYPDVAIICAPLMDSLDILPNSIVLAKVLSPSTRIVEDGGRVTDGLDGMVRLETPGLDLPMTELYRLITLADWH